MKMKSGANNPFEQLKAWACRPTRVPQAFTLIELLVVICVISMLITLLIPALAGTKGDVARAECRNNQKQIGIGFSLFEKDHNEMYPPAVDVGSPVNYLPREISWDSYIHRYIGGKASDAELSFESLDPDVTPPVLICPAAPDRVGWAWNPTSHEELFGRRSYSMVGTPEYFQSPITISGSTFDLCRGSSLVVGVYWHSYSTPTDWEAKSFRTSVAKDPSGTILLVEQPENNNYAANEWPSVSLAVESISFGGMLCQMNSSANLPPQGYGAGVNLGKFVYQNHGRKFNYLFHDGHVEALATNETIGSALGSGSTALTNPKGMWTVKPGD